MASGWNNGLSQDYNRKLGAWFADRPGARQQLKADMNDREIDLALADALDEIERLKKIIAHLVDSTGDVEHIDFSDSIQSQLE